MASAIWNNIYIDHFLDFGLYALSGAGIIRRLPLLKLVMYTIATLCIIRGVLPLQLWVRYPDKVIQLFSISV